MASDKEQVIIQCSPAFKTALDNFALAQSKTMTVIVKRAVAEYIGYADIESELKRSPRTPKYDSPEEGARQEEWRRGLRAWATKTINKMITSGNIELAGIIVRALNDKDYDALDDAREAIENPPDDE